MINRLLGNSLVVQWLGLCAFTTRVQPLVQELRSHKSPAQQKKKRKENKTDADWGWAVVWVRRS